MSILRLPHRWIAIVALASVFVSANVQADMVTLNVNAAQSSLTIGGNAFTLNYVQQNAGSLVANWGGTIKADLTAGVFTFSPGSAITAIVNPSGPYTTAPNVIGSEAGNYGVTASGVVPGFGPQTINGVYKNLILDITAGTAQNGAATVATMNFSAGALDYGIAPAAVTGTSSLANVSGVNASASLVSWNGTTLTIPVSFLTTGSNRNESWNGTIVATIVAVPEPSSIALMSLVGIVGLSYASVRSRRVMRLAN